MCRSIKTLRTGPTPASDDEITAAALQYVRKVSGLRQRPKGAEAEYDAAVAEVAAATRKLLASLPARKQPPATLPPLRRPEVRARLGLQ